MMALASSMQRSFEHGSRPQYVNNMASPSSSHFQAMPNVIQQGNYIYHQAPAQHSAISPRRNLGIDEDCEQQTFYQL